MSTISLCMIVKDEEKVLKRCLNSVKHLFDEIIIVDTGSTDKTKSIAKKFTKKVYNFKWTYDFSAARNYSFSFAKCEYIMWLDADDIIEEKDALAFLKLKESLSKNQIDTAYIKYRSTPNCYYYRERIFKRSLNPKWEDPIHEWIAPMGNKFYSDFEITHIKKEEILSNRNIYIFEKFIKNNNIISPRMEYYYARELMIHKKTEEALKMFNIFLENEHGWVENKISACQDASACYNELYKNSDKLSTDARNYYVKRFLMIVKSFEFDIPRPKSCCLLAEYFLEKEMFEQSIYWYKAALNSADFLDNSADKTKQLGFIESDFNNLVPYIQLCIIYWALGDKEKAIYYNDLAGKVNESHPAYLQNKLFFSKN